MSVPTLYTQRLTLRGLEPVDTEAIVGIFADPEMSRFFAADFSDAAQCRAMVERRLAYDGPDGMGHWVLEHDGELVGLAHLRPTRELPGELAEIGYFLGRTHGGRGLATQAAAALLDHGFGTLGLPTVWALIHESNVASRKLAERLGFLDVGGDEHYGGPHRVYVASPGSGRQATTPSGRGRAGAVVSGREAQQSTAVAGAPQEAAAMPGGEEHDSGSAGDRATTDPSGATSTATPADAHFKRNNLHGHCTTSNCGSPTWGAPRRASGGCSPRSGGPSTSAGGTAPRGGWAPPTSSSRGRPA